MWILTSNVMQLVSQPLLSRMRVFDIAGLTPMQSNTTAKQIFADVVDDLGIEFDRDLPTAIASTLAEALAREMHRISREMVAHAVRDGRREVVKGDPTGLMSVPAAASQVARVSVTVEMQDDPIAAEAAAATKH